MFQGSKYKSLAELEKFFITTVNELLQNLFFFSEKRNKAANFNVLTMSETNKAMIMFLLKN